MDPPFPFPCPPPVLPSPSAPQPVLPPPPPFSPAYHHQSGATHYKYLVYGFIAGAAVAVFLLNRLINLLRDARVIRPERRVVESQSAGVPAVSEMVAELAAELDMEEAREVDTGGNVNPGIGSSDMTAEMDFLNFTSGMGMFPAMVPPGQIYHPSQQPTATSDKGD